MVFTYIGLESVVRNELVAWSAHDVLQQLVQLPTHSIPFSLFAPWATCGNVKRIASSLQTLHILQCMYQSDEWQLVDLWALMPAPQMLHTSLPDCQLYHPPDIGTRDMTSIMAFPCTVLSTPHWNFMHFSMLLWNWQILQTLQRTTQKPENCNIPCHYVTRAQKHTETPAGLSRTT
jgi:hypothetical protein